jgi:hypothetical protein
VPGLQVELAAEEIELRELRLLEGHVLALEHCARVHHRRIEEGSEEVVADVVMRGNVAAAAGASSDP